MPFSFNEFQVDPESYQLRLGDEIVAMEPQAFDLLVYLIENRERVVSRDELLQNLWPGKVVTDAALSARLKAVRKAVGDTGKSQNIIKTTHGRGYQFVAKLEPGHDITVSTKNETAEKILQPFQDESPSIAVLPFQNLSGDSSQQWFADGVTDAIVNTLSRSSLFVVSSYLTVEDNYSELKQVIQDRGIRLVLEGSVLNSGDRIRVSAQLVDVVSGENKWADRYDRELKDIFEVQDDISKNLITALQGKLVVGELADMWAAGTESVEAWTYVVQGFLTVDRMREQDFFQTKRFADKAIAIDPNYVSAWTLKAFAYADACQWEWDGDFHTMLDQAVQAVQRGVELDPEEANNLAALAYIYTLQGNIEKAIEVSEKAFSIAPNSMDVLGMYGLALLCSGDINEAAKKFQQAIDRVPTYPFWIITMLGVCYFLSSQSDSATQAFEEGLAREPQSPYCMPWLIVSLMSQGRTEDARAIVARLLELEPNFSISRWYQPQYGNEVNMRDARAKLIEAGIPK